MNDDNNEYFFTTPEILVGKHTKEKEKGKRKKKEKKKTA